MRYAYLIKVDANSNNNKFYEMIETESGQIELYNGRVESSRVSQTPKPSSQWNKIYNSKIKKGYSDVGKFRSIKTEKNTSENLKYKEISDLKVSEVINKLQSYAGESVEKNYNIKAVSVTQEMIDEAQSVIDFLNSNLKIQSDNFELNKKLQYLFSVIPRKMKKVKDYLLPSLTSKDAIEEAKKILSNEQDILDSMASQVVQKISDLNSNEQSQSDKKDKTILDDLGLFLEHGDSSDYDFVKAYMKDYDNSDASNQLYRVYKAKNFETQKRFDNFLTSQVNKKTEIFWHGSRSAVWWYIYLQGLSIRPSASNGSLFGRALYFADKYAKSRGYTDFRGSYWSKGSSNEAFLGLFDVHVGNQKIITNIPRNSKDLNYDEISSKGYDSVFAKSGYGLQNNEYMTYTNDQSTIKYLVWIKG